MLTGIRITLDGQLETVTLDDTTTARLVHNLHRAIGCDTFDVVGLPLGISLYVDDDGISRSTLNPILSFTAAHLGAPAALFGAGVFLSYDADSGESRSLTHGHARAVVAAYLTAIIDLVRDNL
ncbi:hypothetical protein AB2L57_01725 [Microbacterium sp. HA-8]|uniref:DUF3846 domain-containing protein n=1 Tax=Microbacterium sp. HA-8 TaxID=3234200 RepID=UPI0038F658D5